MWAGTKGARRFEGSRARLTEARLGEQTWKPEYHCVKRMPSLAAASKLGCARCRMRRHETA
jgi:hypothetical protein